MNKEQIAKVVTDTVRTDPSGSAIRRDVDFVPKDSLLPELREGILSGAEAIYG